MKKVIFDFNQLKDLPMFHRYFAQQFDLDDSYGANLDALWDVVTGAIELPVTIEFINLDARSKRRFASFILLFEEAEEEMGGNLCFNFSLQQKAGDGHLSRAD